MNSFAAGKRELFIAWIQCIWKMYELFSSWASFDQANENILLLIDSNATCSVQMAVP